MDLFQLAILAQYDPYLQAMARRFQMEETRICKRRKYREILKCSDEELDEYIRTGQITV